MSERTRELLPEYLLGALPSEQRSALERELVGNKALVAELGATAEAFSALVETLPAEIAPAAVRSRLLETLAGPRRFHDFVADLARHFDLAAERVKALMASMDDPSVWLPGPMPGIFVMHFAGGPLAIAPDTGFVRLPAGLAFPYHRHQGHEINYVMEGSLRDGDGTLYRPGQAIVKTPGSEHEFSVGPERDAIIAVIQQAFDVVPKPGA